MRSTIIIALLLSITLLVYWQVHDHEFINYDDPVYILENTHIQSGFSWESIRWAFSTGYASNWHPITWLTLIWDYERFGDRPAGYHLVNLMLHCANVVLLFFLLKQFTHLFWQPMFIAALFALHPLHVESVAWASARKDLLSALFLFLSVSTYYRYAVENKRWYLWWTSVLFAVSLMAKPVGVMLPLLLLLLDFWPLNRLVRSSQQTSAEMQRRNTHPALPLVVEKIPLFVLAAGSAVITILVQYTGGAVSSTSTLSFFERVTNASSAYLSYLGKMFWPADLAVFYPHASEQISLAMFIGTAGLLLALSLMAWRYRKQFPYLLTGWLWYLVALVPMIGVVQVGAQASADRYTYLPMIGMYLIIAWGVTDLTKRWNLRPQILTVLGVCVVIILALLSFRQVSVWKNSVTLFEHALASTDNNWLAHHNLGTALLARGNLERARSEFQRTMEIQPKLWYTHYNLYLTYSGLGKRDSAMIHLAIAKSLNPALEADR